MRKSLIIAVLLLAGCAFQARAQFYTPGEDPGYLRWYTIETPYYKIIYPEGTDSLARRYGRLLEQFRVPLGRSLNFTPGARQRRFEIEHLRVDHIQIVQHLRFDEHGLLRAAEIRLVVVRE